MPHLRPAHPDDAPALAAIAAAAYARYVRRIGRPPAPMLADYDQVLATAEVWVADDDGRPVGFAVLAERPGHLLLENVAVHPDQQGQGIGRTLLDHAEDRARDRDLPQIRLYTHETMTENLAIYRSRGYHETARRIEDGYRRVHLTKPLHQASLRTPRLTLVPLADEHLDDEAALDADPDVMRHLDPPRTRAQVEGFHAHRLDVARRRPGLGYWAGIVDDGFVGWWVLQPPHRADQGPADGQAELGYRLHRRRWRQGLASEGARELVRHGFADLGLTRIFGETMTVNTASRATLTSIGLQYVRTLHLPGDDPRTGAEHGRVQYALTRDDWTRRPQAAADV
jgi:RimJ/RimL family protein N-acetyltransferase/ribosomal protein S18 acetylase RimI-like enzyme